MRLDRKSMGLVREEIRIITKECQALERSVSSFKSSCNEHFRSHKALNRDAALYGIKRIHSVAQGSTMISNRYADKSPNLQGASTVFALYAKASDTLFSNVDEVLATKSLTSEQLYAKHSDRIERTNVLLAQLSVAVNRKLYKERHTLVGVGFNFHTLCRMIERGFCKSHPVRYLITHPDFVSLIGLSMLQRHCYLTSDVSPNTSMLLPLNDGVLTGNNVMELFEETPRVMLGTEPYKYTTTCKQSIAKAWDGRSGDCELLINPYTHFRNDRGILSSASGRITTFLDRDMMRPDQDAIADELAAFLKQHRETLESLYWCHHIPESAPENFQTAFTEIREQMISMMSHASWRQSFSAKSALTV